MEREQACKHTNRQTEIQTNGTYEIILIRGRVTPRPSERSTVQPTDYEPDIRVYWEVTLL